MRGKLKPTLWQYARRRIIPAHAGQTPVWKGHAHGTTDHPRACGANSRMSYGSTRDAGSSPRMRGKPWDADSREAETRIIPAHAGQTRRLAWIPRPLRGSSPRMRGKRRRDIQSPLLARIIPAHAGQTAHVAGFSRIYADHPRACGANTAVCCSSVSMIGSSPRMRGKRRPYSPPSARHRIIPAHAGQTRNSRSSRQYRSDHPRACGANSPILCENS